MVSTSIVLIKRNKTLKSSKSTIKKLDKSRLIALTRHVLRETKKNVRSI